MSSDRPARGDEEPNYLALAFKSQYNLIGLGTAVGFAILSGSILPMLVAAGLELTLLPFAERWARLKRAKDRAQAEKQRQASEVSDMMGALTHEERQRYRTLEVLAGEIRSNYKGLDSSSQLLLDDLVKKLEFLLAFYLRMRYSLMRYVSYFATTDPDEIRFRIGELEKEMGSGPERVRAIKARTRAVLQKRLLRFDKARENKDLIEAQTETVQEVLRLLRDQSYSIRDPRSITEQLDGLVSSSEQTERGVKDMEDLLDLQNDAVMPRVHDQDIETELERGRDATPREAAPQATARPRIPEPLASPPPPPPQRKKITH